MRSLTFIGRLPGRLPIRWRLAAVSSLMTLLILLGFALLVGQTTTKRLRNDFDTSLSVAAVDLQDQLRVQQRVTGGLSISGPDLDDYAGAQKAVIRVINSDGTVIGETKNAPNLGMPVGGSLTVGDYRVVARRIAAPLGFSLAWVQYARRPSDLNNSIEQIWILLFLGVLGGSLLALLAGWAVARRAMSPIAELTKATKEVGETRDPGRKIPQPEAKDEVTDLAKTLEEMLESLNQARAEREAVLQAQREFIADASHELRTPLTSVFSNLELLHSELHDSEEKRELIEAALRSSRRMRNLVRDLLLLARTDTGRHTRHVEVNLCDTVNEALAEIAPLSSTHQLDVLTPRESLPVDGNPEELHRLVLNLLDNAVRHTPPGTRVEVKLDRKDGEVRLQVSDYGPGIPSEIRGRVFDRFVSTGTKSSLGTGLGLAIVRAVSESHLGSVAVHDNAGGGVRFVVTLPISGSDTRGKVRPQSPRG